VFPPLREGGKDRARRVLLLTHRVPFPPDRGDRIRSFHLARTLAQHFTLDIACVSDEPITDQQRRALSGITDRLAIEKITKAGGIVRGGIATLIGQAGTPALFFSGNLAQTIVGWHHEKPFDAVLTFCSGMVRYTQRLIAASKQMKRPRPLHVLDLVDVDSLKWRTYAKAGTPMRLIYTLESHRLRKIESGSAIEADAITVVSENEAAAYRGHVGDFPELYIVPNGVETAYFTRLPDADTQRLVFVGVLDYRPNVEGVCWFVEQVFPQLRQRLPGVTLELVGKSPTSRVVELGKVQGVTVTGTVPDVRPHLAEAAAAIVPLQIAPGIQNKVLEAMSSARVAVCTTAAARGIDAEDGHHLLIADTPEQWLEQLEAVLTQGPWRRRIAAAAREQVKRHYGWENRLAPMVSLLRGAKPDAHRAKPRQTLEIV
jgi:sugar transferase (PEP-CTERM/EpsH1 system associated)